MSGEVAVTLVGTTGAPAELRFTPSGSAVASFSLAVTARQFDKQTKEWKDKATVWYRVSVWNDQAENVAETLIDKGMRVVVFGYLEPREFETDGVKRMSLDVRAEEVAPSLRYASAKVSRTQRGAGNGGFGGQASGQQSSAGGFGGQAEDPWATGPKSDQEPPF